MPQPLCGPGSSVGIATGYELDSPGIESWWGKTFCTCPDQPWGPTQPPAQWVPGLSRGVKSGRGVRCRGHERVQLYLYPFLWAIQPIQSLSACTRVHFTLPQPLHPWHKIPGYALESG